MPIDKLKRVTHSEKLKQLVYSHRGKDHSNQGVHVLSTKLSNGRVREGWLSLADPKEIVKKKHISQNKSIYNKEFVLRGEGGL